MSHLSHIYFHSTTVYSREIPKKKNTKFQKRNPIRIEENNLGFSLIYGKKIQLNFTREDMKVWRCNHLKIVTVSENTKSVEGLSPLAPPALRCPALPCRGSGKELSLSCSYGGSHAPLGPTLQLSFLPYPLLHYIHSSGACNHH